MKLIIKLFFVSLFLNTNAQTKKILFLGNSYTQFNNLPSLVENMALSLGDTITTNSNLPGGYTFNQHTTNAASLALLQQGNWDYVVLQEQSQTPAFPLSQVQSSCFPYAKLLDSLVNAFSPCAETIFYMTWGRKNGDASNCANFPPLCTYLGMDSLLRIRYDSMAINNKALIAPAGPIWRYLRNNHASIELYNADESHPSIAGSYAAACGIYVSIFKKNPALIAYVPAGLSAADAQVIRNAAKIVAFDSLKVWHIGAYNSKAFFSYTNISTLGISCFNSSTSGNGQPNSYTWYFGDGQTSTLTNPIHTYSTDGFYTLMLVTNNCGASDTFITNLNLGPDAINNNLDDNIKVFPTITDAAIYIESKEHTLSEIRLYNLLGQPVLASDFNNTNKANLSLGVLTSGIYFLKFRYNGKNYNQRILKQ
jgi:PKD domain/Secretion system C-terminal sorting domain